MRSVSPIRNLKDIEILKLYLRQKNIRDYLLFVLGINSNLRISDLLNLKFQDVWIKNKPKEYIELKEQKTGKHKKIKINDSMSKAIREYVKSLPTFTSSDYLFFSKKNPSKPISRQQAHFILKTAGQFCGIDEPISPHSLRKTWGYWAWKNGVSLILIMEALNHSNTTVTKRYLGIMQDDIDDIYINLNL